MTTGFKHCQSAWDNMEPPTHNECERCGERIPAEDPCPYCEDEDEKSESRE